MEKITAQVMAVKFWKAIDHICFENQNPKSILTVEDFEMYNTDKGSLISAAIELHLNYNTVLKATDVDGCKNIFMDSIKAADIAKTCAVGILETKKGEKFLSTLIEGSEKLTESDIKNKAIT